MFYRLSAIVLSCFILSTPAVANYENDGKKMQRRCSEDHLTYHEAFLRNRWALRCGHISYRTYEYNINDDNRVLRQRFLYPSFFNPRNFRDWIKTPTFEFEPCDIRDYTKKMYCVSEF